MAEFPVPLDNLITYVKGLHPGADALVNLTDAIQVSARLDEQSDALIGHFVDQARRSGASWSQIGASMGVSKQAAQQRFVPRTDAADLLPKGQEMFARFAPRARGALSSAERTATAAGADAVSDTHLAVALLSQPQGVAATVIHEAGVTDDQITGALGLTPAEGDVNVSGERLGEIAFDDTGTAALRGALKAALRLGHNYIGTEHLLLGVLFGQGPAAQALTGLGLTVERVEDAVSGTIRRIARQMGRD